MDDKLEGFVTLLNKQRQARPLAPEPVRAPSWAQRVFSRHIDVAPAPKPAAVVAPVVVPAADDEIVAAAQIESAATEIAPAAIAAPAETDIAEPATAAPGETRPDIVAETVAGSPAIGVAERVAPTVEPPVEIAVAPPAAEEPVADAMAAAPTSDVAEPVSVAAEPVAEPIADAPMVAAEEAPQIEAASVEIAAAAPPAPEELVADATVAAPTIDVAELVSVAAEPIADAPMVAAEEAPQIKVASVVMLTAEEPFATVTAEPEPAAIAESSALAVAEAIVEIAAAPLTPEELAVDAAAAAAPTIDVAEPVSVAAETVAEPIADAPMVAAEEAPQIEAASVVTPTAEEPVATVAAEPEAAAIAELPALAIEEPSAEAVAAAPLAPEELAVDAPVAAPTIDVAEPVSVAAETVAEPIADAPMVAAEEAQQIEAASVVMLTAEEPVATVAAEPEAAAIAELPALAIEEPSAEAVAVLSPALEQPIAAVTDAAAADDPVAEATAIETLAATPRTIAETPTIDIAAPPQVTVEPVAADEPLAAVAAAMSSPGEELAAVEAAAVPEAASPRIAAIFARITIADSVSAAIAESAAAAVTPPAEAPTAESLTGLAAASDGVTDALRDPHDLLARFLAETDIAVAPAPEQVLAEAAAKLDEVLHAVADTPLPPAGDTPVRDTDADDSDEPGVPLSVMAEQVAAARAARGYLRYGLTAVAVVVGIVVVGGAYWSTETASLTIAGTHDGAATTALNVTAAKPVVARVDPPAAAHPAAPRLTATAKADGGGRAPSDPSMAAHAATLLASLPPPKAAGGLTIVEAESAPPPPPHVPAAALAGVPRQLAMLTPPPPEPPPPPAPVTSSMAPPPTAAPPAAAPAPAAATGPVPTWQRYAAAAPAFSGKPQIAIVIDDLGIDRDRTERSVGLDSAVTLSFLAYASDLPTQTAAARRAGHELIVHVPMEPAIRPKYVAQISGGEAQAELLRRLRWDLSRFNGYVGVNNHMGSRLSADPQAMRTVIGELKSRGLLFLDSRLDGNTIDVARREGVAAVGRDVLLDDDITATSVGERLAEVEKMARQHGTAIALGHPHDQTINALKLWITSLPAKGLQLVPLSAIVKDREGHVAGARADAG